MPVGAEALAAAEDAEQSLDRLRYQREAFIVGQPRRLRQHSPRLSHRLQRRGQLAHAYFLPNERWYQPQSHSAHRRRSTSTESIEAGLAWHSTPMEDSRFLACLSEDYADLRDPVTQGLPDLIAGGPAASRRFMARRDRRPEQELGVGVRRLV